MVRAQWRCTQRAGSIIWHQRVVALRTHPRAGGRGQLSAPNLGALVARAGRVFRLHPAPATLAPPRPAAGESSATPARAGVPLVGVGGPGVKTGTMVHAQNSSSCPI